MDAASDSVFDIEEFSNESQYRSLLKIYKKPPFNLPIDKDWSKRPCIFATTSKQNLELIHNFEVREDDVWICTYPKSGTTWMQEIAWILQNNFDYGRANTIDIADRSSYLEFFTLYRKSSNTLELANSLPTPRLIKTHLPIPLLPRQLWTKNAKIIYVARDPRDVVISYYHHMKAIGTFRGTIEEYLNRMLTDKLMSTPYWSHVLEFWQIRNKPNVLFTSYERMQNNLETVVLKVAQFLGKGMSVDELKEIVYHTSFNQMKNNPMCNHEKESMEARRTFGLQGGTNLRFMRKGKVGSYKEELNEEQIKAIDDWSTEQLGGESMSDILYN